MDWILRRRHRSPLSCYLRENGPIAYEATLFARAPRECAEAMLGTGLTWFWKTTAAAAVVRDWTELSRWSLAALLGDLGEQKESPARVLAIAIEPQDSAASMTDARVAVWIRAFNGAAAAPLHAVVSHPASGDDLLFVAQQPPESIRLLLHGWKIDRDRAERRAYARLRERALEDLIHMMR
jgi:hypothetical protein